MILHDSPSRVQRKKIQKSLTNLFPQLVKKYKTTDDSPENLMYSTLRQQTSIKTITLKDKGSPFYSPKYTKMEGFNRGKQDSIQLKLINSSPVFCKKKNDNPFLCKDMFNAHLAYMHHNQHNGAIQKMAQKILEFQKGKIKNIIKQNHQQSEDNSSCSIEKEKSKISQALELSFQKSPKIQQKNFRLQGEKGQSMKLSSSLVKSQRQESNFGFILDQAQENQHLKNNQLSRRDQSCQGFQREGRKHLSSPQQLKSEWKTNGQTGNLFQNQFNKIEPEELHLFFQNLFMYFKNVLQRKNGYSVISKLSGFTNDLHDFLFKLNGTQYQFKYQKWEQIYYTFLKKEGIEQLQPNFLEIVLKNHFYKVLAFISSQLKEQMEQLIFKQINGHNDRIVQLRGDTRGLVEVSEQVQLGTKMLLKNIETFNIQYGKIKTLRDIDIFEFQTLERTSDARKKIINHETASNASQFFI